MIEFSICVLMVVLGLLGGIAATFTAIVYDKKTLDRLNKMAGKSNLQ